MPARACDTGQFALAPAASSWNASSLSPGTSAWRVRWLPVMPTPGLKPTDAVVSSFSAGVPLSASALESAIEKQDACAAAISSSGVVVADDDFVLDYAEEYLEYDFQQLYGGQWPDTSWEVVDESNASNRIATMRGYIWNDEMDAYMWTVIYWDTSYNNAMAKTFFVPEYNGYDKADKMGKKVSSTVGC